MISQKKFQVIHSEEIRIKLSDLTLCELFREVIQDFLLGTVDLLKMDSLLYLLHFAEFRDGVKDRIYLKEAECIMRTGAYESDFGYARLGDLLCELRSRLRYDYFVRGSLILTRDNLLVNDKLYILPILD